MFQRFLICTELTDGLQRLVNFVPSLAAAGAQKIIFLHTIPLSEDQAVPRVDQAELDAVRDRLSVAQDNVPEDIEVQVEVQVGRPVDRILNTAKTYKADLIILGTPSRSLLNEKLFGSTTMSLCQRVATAVLILRPQLLFTYTIEELDLRCRHLFRHLLIPYDGSRAANYLIERIKQYAQERPSQVLKECSLCWVVEEGGRFPRANVVEEAKAKLQAVKTELEALGLKVGAEVFRGEPIVEVLKAGQEHDISAIACSSDSLGKLIEWSSPSFAGEILRRSWQPVIYFPPAKP
ncbi:MAG: universal stress protein [Cyanobacteria bacterium RU_5_0]|nr:universal stress protein [Cyanobacteria bacterium RU_5_0]